MKTFLFYLFIWTIISIDFGTNDSDTISDEKTITEPITVENKLDHLSKFQKIIKRLNDLLLSYKICIDRVRLENFEKIKNYCLGENNQLIENDLNFEMLRIIAQTAKKVKYIMINYCFTVAGANMVYQDSCEIYQTDVLDLLWRKYDTMNIIKSNRDKYIFEHGKLPGNKYDELNIRMDKIINNNNEIIKEITHWKSLIIWKIKEFVSTLSHLPDFLNKKKYNELTSNFIKQVISSLATHKSVNFKNMKMNELNNLTSKLIKRDGSVPINPNEIIPEVIKAEETKEKQKNSHIEKFLKQKNINEKLKEKLKQEEENKLQNIIKQNSEIDKETKYSGIIFITIISNLLII